MSEKANVKAAGVSSQLWSNGQDESDKNQGVGTQVFVQDQVIIAPEIMKMILEHLDLRSLKQVRLTCKSWLREAQAHIEPKGIVRLHTHLSSSRIKNFIDCCQKKPSHLPRPFKSLELGLLNNSKDRLPHELLQLRSQLQLSILCKNPQLVITRLAPSELPLDLALPLILQCSSSLEMLRLDAETCKPGYLPQMDPKQDFPKLWHIGVKTRTPRVRGNNRVHFGAIVAWIIRGCPQLETFEALGNYSEESVATASQLVLESDITHVKNLLMMAYSMNQAAFDHFLSIPFTRLQDLRIMHVSGPVGGLLPMNQALLSTVTQAATTLTFLDLAYLQILDELLPTEYEFPICPNVHELVLMYFLYSNNFISEHFPSVQIIHAQSLDIVLENGWNGFPSYEDLKTLRIRHVRISCGDENYSVINGHEPMMFFERFPGLECLSLKPVTLLACCSVKSGGDPAVSNILDGVKQLELFEKDTFVGAPDPDDGSSSSESFDYGLLSTLKGVETITFMEFDQAVTTLPVRDLPFLKLIEFPWVLTSDALGVGIDQLLDLASGVEKVAVTNCCAIPRLGDQQSKELLKQFFDSAPNVVCGCLEWGKRTPW